MVNKKKSYKKGKWIVILKKLQRCSNCDIWLENTKELSKHKELYQCDSQNDVSFIEESNDEDRSLEASSPKEDTFSKKYKCDNCQRYFLRNSILQRHKRTVHAPIKNEILEENSRKKYKCEYCQRECSRNSHLQDHKRRIHGDFGDMSGEHVCEKCNKEFSG